MPIKVCLYCKTEFHVKASHYETTKFCSMECRRKKAGSHEFICEVCGKVKRTRKSWNPRYCSRECQGKARRKRVEKVCLYCGQYFSVYPSREVGKYCSKKCQDLAAGKPGIIKKCEECGKSYKAHYRDAENSRYCSKACYHIGHTDKRICAYCGANFEIKKSSKQKYCCKECANEDYRIRFAAMTYDRIDANQEEIILALQAIGASVVSLASVKYGCPDLIVGITINGISRNYLFEVKSKKGKLTPAQEKFFETWRGQKTIVRTPEQAVEFILDDQE